MTAEMVLVENSCIPVHLTCGTYALCSTEFMSADEMMQTVLAMEEFYCG
jgi:hypothetical protein